MQDNLSYSGKKKKVEFSFFLLRQADCIRGCFSDHRQTLYAHLFQFQQDHQSKADLFIALGRNEQDTHMKSVSTNNTRCGV